MAIGAIEALQTYGYNKEDKSKKAIQFIKMNYYIIIVRNNTQW